MRGRVTDGQAAHEACPTATNKVRQVGVASGQKSKFIERVTVRPPVKPVGSPKNGEVSTPLKLRGWL